MGSKNCELGHVSRAKKVYTLFYLVQETSGQPKSLMPCDFSRRHTVTLGPFTIHKHPHICKPWCSQLSAFTSKSLYNPPSES